MMDPLQYMSKKCSLSFLSGRPQLLFAQAPFLSCARLAAQRHALNRLTGSVLFKALPDLEPLMHSGAEIAIALIWRSGAAFRDSQERSPRLPPLVISKAMVFLSWISAIAVVIFVGYWIQ
ncbi:hypothetical protein BLX42_23230 [Pseudomonas sp. SG-MS2]|nr:hypothetical protein BLX42_23230 [Pseudomonas sp. SG-MS2]